MIVTTDEIFEKDRKRGYVILHSSGKPIFVIRESPGQIMFSNGMIEKAEWLVRAEREFNGQIRAAT